ncbi:unnamed protein product [Trichogramma brassicae]|uniref:Double jelly roll-like domain-containing protein n=1 Tax=Trichogramma brassicae TaxID=86971 RepID=A0A6H5J2L2_9HYME|nr:unnamed protein product [Trichogramma brassicae]
MPYVQLSNEYKIRLLRQIDKPIAMSFRSWELYEYPTLPISTRHVWTVKTSNQLEKPRFVILAFQTNRKAIRENDASLFDHCNLTNVKLFLNSQYYPYNNLNINVAQTQYAALYDIVWLIGVGCVRDTCIRVARCSGGSNHCSSKSHLYSGVCIRLCALTRSNVQQRAVTCSNAQQRAVTSPRKMPMTVTRSVTSRRGMLKIWRKSPSEILFAPRGYPAQYVYGAAHISASFLVSFIGCFNKPHNSFFGEVIERAEEEVSYSTDDRCQGSFMAIARMLVERFRRRFSTVFVASMSCTSDISALCGVRAGIVA